MPSRRLTGSGDHPRGRGEHRRPTQHVWKQVGPSPRARGAHRFNCCGVLPAGTIPAGAGSTPRHPGGCGTSGDHPRGRGEHQALRLISPPAEGPSPRARGALDPAADGCRSQRTIPAGAGSTGVAHSDDGRVGDHPRGRGEHMLFMGSAPGPVGPSPRARGAPAAGAAGREGGGTIPAGAGSTCRCGCCSRWPWDHPRGRGEHTRTVRGGTLGSGPSPRARGARPDPLGVEDRRGTIPAGAGSTQP